jgi:hypothetical protein
MKDVIRMMSSSDSSFNQKMSRLSWKARPRPQLAELRYGSGDDIRNGKIGAVFD